MSISAYLRVSSKAQDYATQRDAIERAAAARGERIDTWYSEKKTGTTMARPEMERLRGDIRTGIVKKLYCFKLDRLTRTGVGDTYRLIDEFKAAGCELVAVADNLHLKPGKDDLVTEVICFALSLAARLEVAAKNDRIAAARDRVEAEGGTWGRPSRFSATDLVKLLALRAEGRTIRQIAVAMKVPRSTVQRALAQKVSAGGAARLPGAGAGQQG